MKNISSKWKKEGEENELIEIKGCLEFDGDSLGSSGGEELNGENFSRFSWKFIENDENSKKNSNEINLLKFD